MDSSSGLKFKGGGSLAKPKKKTGVASGAEKALGLERPKAFKREHADGADSTLPPGSAVAASAAAASSSAAAASSSGVIYPPVVLAPSASGVASKSLWGLNKNELHEIDANLSALREADRSIDKMEASSKRGEWQERGRMGQRQRRMRLRHTHAPVAHWCSLVSRLVCVVCRVGGAREARSRNAGFQFYEIRFLSVRQIWHSGSCRRARDCVEE